METFLFLVTYITNLDGFYIIKNNNDQRTFMAIGQEYNLISYSELMNQDFLSIIWLKRKYTFE